MERSAFNPDAAGSVPESPPAAPEQGIPAQLVKRGAVAVVESVEGPGNVNYYDPRFGCQPAMCFNRSRRTALHHKTSWD